MLRQRLETTPESPAHFSTGTDRIGAQAHYGVVSCSHKTCAPSENEARAFEIVAWLLNDDELSRVCARGAREPTPDFESSRHAVEVKTLVSQSAMSYENAHSKHLGYGQHHPVTSLQNVWVVMTDITDAMASYERDVETPTVRGLIKSLIPLLEQMEQREVKDFNRDYWARAALSYVIGDHGMCYVAPPGGPYSPGILIDGHGWGWERTTDLEDDVVVPVQKWLESGRADNLKESLRNRRSSDALRIAALVVDGAGPAFGMIRTLAESPDVPIRTPLRLSDDVDAVVLVAGEEVLDFGLAGEVWRRQLVKRVRLPDEATIVTHHEAGHAVAALMTVNGSVGEKLTVGLVLGRGPGNVRVVVPTDHPVTSRIHLLRGTMVRGTCVVAQTGAYVTRR